ncbi:BglG family transcription antiterminator [Listeria seeligeri]|uniref:BglG family transcription antiterminator n=1 Tax=Listeria seeligeri TaxID=1640 RepID=UPI0016271D21|nr:BglG family transcription antiterminator [Listeria seeligeri]MBC1727765.1 BglG family transcription antiterminator [Listeria seeligeri]MBC1848123.1 BglG family transcription antiterminator [Listeria seeligeri]MBC1854241.1 BglG family transcription antiterminator [Listeria seeligeri]MBC1870337.1 BglG family transcription antiterminator [Listeria seeligeri]MBC6169753.1 BglG family transcription antiterminator [Listeria seeligeri]
MKLNQQCIQILDFLMEQEDFKNIGYISSELGHSERSVRYSLEKIDVFLGEQNLPALIRHTRKGVLLPEKNIVSPVVNKFKQRITPKKYRYSQEEVQQFLLLKLLLSEEVLPVTYFEEVLFISRSSVLNHLRAIEGELFLNNLDLSHQPRHGFLVTGNLITKSSLFARSFLRFINIREFYQFLDSENSLSKKGELFFYNLFEMEVLQEVNLEARSVEENANRAMDEQLYLTLIAVLLKQHEAKPEFRFEASFAVVDELDKALETIIGSLKQYHHGQEDDVVIDAFVKGICEKMGEIYQVDFVNGETDFFAQIKAHIKLMIRRVCAGVIIENPIFNEFMRDNREIFMRVKESLEALKTLLPISVSSQEISFLAIYFASEVQRNLQTEEMKPNLLIICPEGVAVSKMIATQLEKMFEFESIQTIGLRKFKQEMMTKFDFVISTVDLPDMHDSKVLRIHSYLQKEDLELLQKHLRMKLVKDDKQIINKFSKILAIIGENTQINNLSKLEFDLLEALISDEGESPKKDIPPFYFTEETIMLEKSCPTWRRAIKVGTKCLEDLSIVEPSYHEKIIENLKTYGPYIVIAPGVAIAHAGANDGVLMDGLGVTVIEDGILFYDRYEEPVHVIFTLALNTKEAHSIVEQLMKLALNEEKMNKIKLASSKRDIYHYVKSAIFE